MSIKIALIDNQILFREGLKALLTSFEGISVPIDVDKGVQLISKLSKMSSVPDICIISSPAFMQNNNWTIREIQKRFREMKILVIAPYIHEYTITMLRREDINGFLTKNAKPEELRKAILAIHTKGTYWPKLSEEISAAVEKSKYRRTTFGKAHLQALELCFRDESYVELSKEVGMTMRAFEGNKDYLFKKLKVNSRSSLVLFAIKNGMIDLK